MLWKRMDWQRQPRRSEDFVVAPGSSRSGGQKYTDPSLFSGMRYRVSLTFLQNACEIYMGPTGNPYYYDHFHHKSVGVDLTPEWEIKKDESTGKFYYSKKSMEEKVWIVPTVLQGWEKKISATKGKPCYYNNALKKTTWNLPEIYENQT
jgi:hypothetical protein